MEFLKVKTSGNGKKSSKNKRPKANQLFHTKVAAIIPSFNEARRIGNVLKVVTECNCLDEIIVVDDGSEDDTKEILKEFPQVKYLKNKTNRGKASSLEKGVKHTNADILFFCDADLIGLDKEIVYQIITPVKNGEFNMFLGLVNNFSQKIFHIIAVNSGQRALKRDVWETLPDYFKKKYRIEAGLNHHVKLHFGGFGYKRFHFIHHVKEKKYGFLKGTILRWKMNKHLFLAYLGGFFEE